MECPRHILTLCRLPKRLFDTNRTRFRPLSSSGRAAPGRCGALLLVDRDIDLVLAGNDLLRDLLLASLGGGLFPMDLEDSHALPKKRFF